MAFNIAVAGKGGVGKTTFTGMLVSYLAEQGWDQSWLWMLIQMQT